MFGLSRLAVQTIASGSIVLTLIGWRVWDVRSQQAKGAAKVVEASKKAGEKANATNAKVRAAAREPGAVERLRADKRTCADC